MPTMYWLSKPISEDLRFLRTGDRLCSRGIHEPSCGERRGEVPRARHGNRSRRRSQRRRSWQLLQKAFSSASTSERPRMGDNSVALHSAPGTTVPPQQEPLLRPDEKVPIRRNRSDGFSSRGTQHQDKPGRCPEKTGSGGLQPHDNPGRRRKATALCLRIHRLLRPGRLERLERFL